MIVSSSQLFTQPQTPEEWAQYALTPEQISHFEEFGYLKGVEILTEQQCDVTYFTSNPTFNLQPYPVHAPAPTLE